MCAVRISVCVMALWGAVGWPVAARAHAILLDSQPAVGAVVAAGPARVVLRYNSKIDQGRSRLELRGASQPGAPVLAPTVLKLLPSGADTLTAETTLSPGVWTLRWQVLAVDGHITRGDVPLTVKAP